MRGRPKDRKCGAKKKKGGGLCGNAAGMGTDHVGYGRCKYHLGSTEKHSKTAHEEAALDFAMYALGAEEQIDPLEGQLLAVRLAAGSVAYYRLRLTAYGPDKPPPEKLRESYRQAVLDLRACSESAIRGGVAERMVQITERTAERLTAAFEEALAVAGKAIDNALRAKLVETYAAALTRQEAEAVPVERRLPEAA